MYDKDFKGFALPAPDGGMLETPEPPTRAVAQSVGIAFLRAKKEQEWREYEQELADRIDFSPTEESKRRDDATVHALEAALRPETLDELTRNGD